MVESHYKGPNLSWVFRYQMHSGVLGKSIEAKRKKKKKELRREIMNAWRWKVSGEVACVNFGTRSKLEN